MIDTTKTKALQLLGWYREGSFPALFTDSVSVVKQWMEQGHKVSGVIRHDGLAVEAAPGPSSTATPQERDWKAIDAAIDEYLDGYELRLDEGCHTPTEFERFLLSDAIGGLLAEREFLALLTPAPAAGDALELKRKTDLIGELSKIIHNMTVAQQAAWIEWQHGAGAEAAMQWIENGLAGPGHIPGEDEPYGTEAQAYFDANQADPLPTCHCGRPSNILHMGNGYCSQKHYAAAIAAQQGKGGE